MFREWTARDSRPVSADTEIYSWVCGKEHAQRVNVAGSCMYNQTGKSQIRVRKRREMNLQR